MNDTKSNETPRLITIEEIEMMKIVLDKNNEIGSDENLAELGKIFSEFQENE